MQYRHTLTVCGFCLIALLGDVHLSAAPPDFASDVRPILSDHCFACHGPDSAEREADLRLDTADGIASVIDPAKLSDSEIAVRIESTDSDSVMPPPDFHKPLTSEQKAILIEWVNQGAAFEQHWSFNPPKKPAIERESPIDFFLDRRIADAELDPNERADRRTLLRRVCLDLTGLPPSREQLNEFLSDTSDGAFERLVDRLQQSPHYGEHMARHWLDLVRYGDTHGLHLDNYREMWPYRDWVINAFTQNMPFDQFVTEQLAGDLLPNPTDAQKIASGFNRLNVTTNEGGSIYDEVFARNVIDRTDAFGTIFLGLTTGCAVCHDHKFDPISQRDYYSLSGFFNSLDGRAMDENIKNPAPVLRVLDEEMKASIAEYETELVRLKQEMAGPIESVDLAQAAWEKSLSNSVPSTSVTLVPTEVKSEAGKKLEVRDDHSVELTEEAAAKDTVTIVADFPSDGVWQTLRLDALLDKPDQHVGVSPNGNVVLSEIVIETSSPDSPDEWLPVPIKHALANVEQTDGPFAVGFAIDSKVDAREGWAVAAHQQPGPRTAWFVVPSLMADAKASGSRIRVQLKYQSVYAAHQFRRVRLSLSDAKPSVPKDQQIKFGPIHCAGPFPVESPAPGYSRTFASRGKPFKADQEFKYEDETYQWQQRDDVLPVDVNELPTSPDRATVSVLHQTITAPDAQKVTMLFGSDDGHVIYLNGKRIAIVKGPADLKPLHHEYELPLKKGDNRLYIKAVNHSGDSRVTFAWRSPAVGTPEHLVEMLKEGSRANANQASLKKYYRSVVCLHPDWLARVDQLKGFQASRDKIVEQAPTTLVWKELAKPRPAKILNRGQYDQPGETVPRAAPAFLPPLKPQGPADRIALAEWLCSSENPLAARVAVNRFWQQIFGIGLVKTSEDFGSQGEPPSHPELLDYLAVEFRESGWDVNQLIKSLVMTDAYQRSSKASKRSLGIDPENRLLARGPRHRLDAEVLRDQALALSGLLRTQVGGPSVKPPQPDGLWYAVGYSRSNTAKFTADTDADKVYRRSVYIFWKRTSAPPTMSTFDAPSRESCTARRERTNTPLQALLLMNEVQYLESAKHLAKRVAQQSDLDDDQSRIEWLFETVTIRPPGSTETVELLSLLGDLKSHYRSDLDAAEHLAGERSAEKAAWVVMASTLLNLDEVVTK